MSGYIGNIPVPAATQTRDTFTATAGQTSFATSGYTPSFLDVFMNGVHLVNGTDYTATNGSDVVLTSGAADGDVLEVVAYSTYQVNSQNYTGGLTVDNDGATVLTVDRASSDGTIIDLQKDGSSVGSVGTLAGYSYLGNSGSQSNGIIFTPAGFEPFNSATGASTKDNAMDIGASNQRFQDLYLSGGVYLGGTGSANYLDDYETGTFTPTASSNITINTVENAFYTKVGDLVTLNIWMKVNITSGNFVLGSIPFSISGRTACSFSNVSQAQVITNQCLGTNIYAYNAVTSGTNDDVFISISYRTA